uniref:RGS domain-containing protein n=1 Tax=Panagrolaimus superbus TaxID=310955 RepID=A0A914Y6P5_9BILA
MSFFKSNWDDDYVERTLENICPKEKRYMPDRICGDIPFIQYRSMFATPEKYLRFLKELEKSTSRHDFLFWLFDIITAGQEKERWHISAKDLDAQVRDRVPYIQNILSYAASMDKFSEYMFQEYSKIVKNPNEMDIFNPVLRTFPNTPKIFEYRKNALENSDKSKFFDDYSVEYININPMKSLTISDLPETPPELSFEEFITEKAENQSFFAIYNHFTNLLIYNMHIPDTNTCIFVDKDPYKILQVESYMLRIKVEKLVPINIIKAQELFKKDSIVVVVVVVNDVIPEITNSTDADVDAEDSDFNMQKSIFKRAKLLCNIPSPSPNKIYFCV